MPQLDGDALHLALASKATSAAPDESRPELSTISGFQVRILHRLDAICTAAPGCSRTDSPDHP